MGTPAEVIAEAVQAEMNEVVFGESNAEAFKRIGAAVLDALAAANYTVVQLPEPVDELEWGDSSDEWKVWKRYGSDLVACRVESPLHPEDAQAFAAALLAAVSSLPTTYPTTKEQQ